MVVSASPQVFSNLTKLNISQFYPTTLHYIAIAITITKCTHSPPSNLTPNLIKRIQPACTWRKRPLKHRRRVPNRYDAYTSTVPEDAARHASGVEAFAGLAAYSSCAGGGEDVAQF